MGMGKTEEFWGIVYLAYADVRGGVIREEAHQLEDGPEKKRQLREAGDFPLGMKWTLTARKIFTRLSRGPVVLIVPADLILQTEADFSKYFVKGDPYWKLEVFIEHKNWPRRGLNDAAASQTLQRLRRKDPNVVDNGTFIVIHLEGFRSASFKKLFFVPDEAGDLKPIIPSVVGWDEYPAAGGRSETNSIVVSLREMFENLETSPYPLFIGITGTPIYRTIGDLLAFLSIVCTYKRFDKEEKKKLVGSRPKQILDGDEKEWANNERMCFSTRSFVRKTSKEHEQILNLLGDESYESTALLNKYLITQIGAHNKLACQGVTIRRQPNDFRPDKDWPDKNRFLPLPPLDIVRVFVGQDARYIDGLQKLAKPVDEKAKADYERRLQEWQDNGMPLGEKPKRGLPESTYHLTRCSGSFPVLGDLLNDPTSGFRRKAPFQAQLIQSEGWNTKTLAQLVNARCPVAVHVDELIESCQKLDHLLRTLDRIEQGNRVNIAKGEPLQRS
jgi:hypothetical protein